MKWTPVAELVVCYGASIIALDKIGFLPRDASVVKWISHQASNLKLGVRVPPEAQETFYGANQPLGGAPKDNIVAYGVKIPPGTQ